MTDFRIFLIAFLASLGACSGAPHRRECSNRFGPPSTRRRPRRTRFRRCWITPRIFRVSIAEMAKLPEGVFWQDVQAGDTLVAAAMMGDSVEIGFDGWLPSGTKVDSGFAALRIGSGSILAGLDVALPGMTPGGRRKLVLPPGLAFGEQGTEAIPPNAVVVYDVELRRIIR